MLYVDASLSFWVQESQAVDLFNFSRFYTLRLPENALSV